MLLLVLTQVEQLGDSNGISASESSLNLERPLLANDNKTAFDHTYATFVLGLEQL